MKKWFSVILTLAMVLVLAACGTKDSANEDTNTDEGKPEETELTELVVGASNVPHAEILEEAVPLLKEKGIDLKIETFQDYVIPNKVLESEELDANYFQHIPYLDNQIEEHGYDFEIAGNIHIEPMGIYSKEYDNIADLPEGANIIMSSSVADHGRVLSILEKEGLIKLNPDVDKVAATMDDIIENPKNITFKAEYEPALLPQIFNNNEGDAVAINSNYALDADLNPLEDSIAIEEEDSPYLNVVVVRAGDKNNEAIKTLVEVLHSKEIQDFILDKYHGTVVPVSN